MPFLAAVLVAFGILSRLLPHPPNAVALGAVALYAAARLPRKWAFAVPLVVLITSDLVIDFNRDRPLFDATRLAVYGTLAALVGFGLLPGRSAKLPTRFAASLAASLIFFVTTNFASWACGLGGYPITWAGLMECYAQGVPFFRYTVAADLIGTAVLFGIDGLAHRYFVRNRAGAEAL